MLAKQGKRINGLTRLLANPILWKQAYANIYSNKGAVTKGSDGSSLDGMSNERLEKLKNAVLSGTYRFTPVRRVLIPKSNGKTRPLGIPNGDDKIVQEVVRMLLEKIYEPAFSDNSHGFRNIRSCHTALTQVRHKWTGVKWIVNMDIKGYFDNINHDKLIDILAKKIDDKALLRLIRSMLKAGYVEDFKFHNTYSGTPQGGIISPILANIYLDELDKFVEGKIRAFDKGSRRAANPEYKCMVSKTSVTRKSITNAKAEGDEPKAEALMLQLKALQKRKKQLPSKNPYDPNYRRLVYIRYADDFLIGVIGTRNEALEIMREVTEFLGNELHLEISTEKSGVINASEGVRFLGYEVKTYSDNSESKVIQNGKPFVQRNVRARLQLHTPAEKLIKFCQNKGYGNYYTLYAKHRPSLMQNSEAEIVSTYNAEMRGIANYYALATNAKSSLGKLYFLWEGSLLKTLAAKRQTSLVQVKQSLKHNGSYALKVKDKVFPIYSLKDMKTAPSAYYHIDIPPITWQFTHTRTELIQRMDAKVCEYCGTTEGNFEVHHIRKLKDVAKADRWWKVVMARQKRKTLALCVSCHDKLHAGKL
jgi:RNA-directed DNA polymerase